MYGMFTFIIRVNDCMTLFYLNGGLAFVSESVCWEKCLTWFVMGNLCVFIRNKNMSKIASIPHKSRDKYIVYQSCKGAHCDSLNFWSSHTKCFTPHEAYTCRLNVSTILFMNVQINQEHTNYLEVHMFNQPFLCSRLSFHHKHLRVAT